jgi:hypothetical protein
MVSPPPWGGNDQEEEAMSTMTLTEEVVGSQSAVTKAFARAIAASRRVRWDIDRDVIRGRRFDTAQKFLPDGLSLVGDLSFLSRDEQRYLSQIQGRTYANVFGLVERFINAKVLELSADHFLGDQIALEGLIRFSDEELKHQELFRRIEKLAGSQMPSGYHFVADPNKVARAVLGARTWAVLALTLHIELFTQLHYLESIDKDPGLSELFRDVFRFHWMEESQHAIMDDLEWRRIDAPMSAPERDQAVDEFIGLVGAVDGILQAQADSDARYFESTSGRVLTPEESHAVGAGLLKAYRWQYILSGSTHPRFLGVLTDLTTASQRERIQTALGRLA